MRCRPLKNILFRNLGKIKGNPILLSNIIYEGLKMYYSDEIVEEVRAKNDIVVKNKMIQYDTIEVRTKNT